MKTLDRYLEQLASNPEMPAHADKEANRIAIGIATQISSRLETSKDLTFEVKVKPNDWFEMKRNTVYMNLVATEITRILASYHKIDISVVGDNKIKVRLAK